MKAAFGIDKKLQVKETEKPKPNSNQLLVKTIACAGNPTDWKHIELWGFSGVIAGSDASGIVEEVGTDVKGFKVGDIVGTYDHGDTDVPRGKYAEYILANPDGTIKVSGVKSDALPVGTNASTSIDTFEALASIPMGLATVGVSFNYTLNIPKTGNENDYILIWGGSSATGILAIQIAKLVYNLKVITTCSAKNADFIKSLGADAVFDYHDESVVEKIKTAANGKLIYVLDTAGSVETLKQAYDATIGSPTKAFDCLTVEKPKVDASRNISTVTSLVYAALGEDTSNFGYSYPDLAGLVKSYKHFWTELLPPVIPKLKTANLIVLEPGLESAQESFDILRAEKVSAEKVVFRV